jgi:hypothetical protein
MTINYALQRSWTHELHGARTARKLRTPLSAALLLVGEQPPNLDVRRPIAVIDVPKTLSLDYRGLGPVSWR